MRSGISSLQGSHHVAQKFSRMIFPLYDENFTSAPFMSFTVNWSGAVLPTALASSSNSGTRTDSAPSSTGGWARSDAAHNRPRARATEPIAIHAARRDSRGSRTFGTFGSLGSFETFGSFGSFGSFIVPLTSHTGPLVKC